VQVEDAKRQVQDIAIKAIEGASGPGLSHIDKIAMEQAKTRTSKLKSEKQRHTFWLIGASVFL
jgi:hypothetical protein